MNYWLTTHWPAPADTPASEPHGDVWVKDGKWNVIKQLAPGDLVFIYESRSGPLPLRYDSHGLSFRAPKALGREGIVALVRVVEPAKQPAESAPELYDNGQKMWWRYRAVTEPVNSGGFIRRSKFLPLLGYKATWNLHGFGDNNSGVKRLEAHEFTGLRKLYEESADQEDRKRDSNNTRGGHFGGCGGEGEVHKALKELIAADPAGVLGEDGLSLFQLEYPFKCTGDRIDVVLRDKDKKYVAVEVEVECDKDHRAGPLQCIKYRAMLAYVFDRPLKEVRCILVAHKIVPTIRARCAAFGIETATVARPTSSA
jgi:hypothetical protein